MTIDPIDEDAVTIPEITVEHFSIPSQLLHDSHGSRLDASHFNPRVAHALEVLRHSGMRLVPLGQITKRVFIPNRFKRSYVAEGFGLPFLQGSHVTHLQPADLKYVSAKVHKKIADWIIHRGWILVTRSGTVGRVAMTPQAWDGWAASEHILRVVPDDDLCPSGYLYSFLASPLGHVQLTNQIYGAVVDELTEDQTKSVLVPLAVNAAQEKEIEAINDAIFEAVEARSLAVTLLTRAVEGIGTLVGRDMDEQKLEPEVTTTRDNFMRDLKKVVGFMPPSVESVKSRGRSSSKKPGT
jgi:hypothetical protein